jgi:sugar phosphate isomerase/epimerase
MSYQRAFSSLGCPEFSLEQTLALAQRHALPAIELRALGGTVDLPEYLTRTYGSPAALAGNLRGQPVRIIVLGTSLKLVGAAPGDREKFLAFVPWAEALGVPHLRVFDGGVTLDSAELAEAAATMNWWRGQRVQHGWQTDLLVETHDTLITAGIISRFLAAVPAAILWDTHHTWKKGGEDPVATWRTIGSQVGHIHVKDSVSRPGPKHPFTYVLPGAGEFPMAPLRRLLESEYAGAVSLEWERLWHPALPPLEAALQAAAGWW